MPRDSADDYSEAMLDTRRRWLEARTNANLGALAGGPIDPHVFAGNIESHRHCSIPDRNRRTLHHPRPTH